MQENNINGTTLSENKTDVLNYLGLEGDEIIENDSTQNPNSGSALLNPLSDADVSTIISPFDSGKESFFVDLEIEMPQEGSRIPFKIDNCQIDKNQLTKYGIKTAIRMRMNGYYADEKFLVVTETFYLTPGEQVNGRFKLFCQDLFSAFGLKSADLLDLIGFEGTAFITYTTGTDGTTRWPHLSQFKSLS
ncbi:MAG: hypothetical protein PWP62_2392 [Eubacteriaceae bacterium]|nr:hypothetical protein [Eubacteriaceae bacterium]MDK2961214.1 hypothetical protein [Eubacteriaceae bacterium]